MDLLWSASTTMRNPERAYSFLETISEIDGYEWNEETQMVFQSLLIKNRYYKPTKRNLSQQQIDILEDLTYNMSYEEARKIFDSKNYVDAPMRGRTSFDPIEKLGLVSLERNEEYSTNKICVTELGKKFLAGELELDDVVFSNLLKFQYPNPLTSDCRNYNTKPFINTLRLIKRVNELCVERNEKAKGISKDEFGIFVLSIKNYEEIEEKAVDLLEYRYKMSTINDEEEKQAFRTSFVETYLSTFKDPVNNTKEYTDNMVRYLRLTKYIFIRGGGYYIDLEPRRMIEINALLENDNGSAIDFTEDEYKKYIADIAAYVLPFETLEKLTAIARDIIEEINELENELALQITTYQLNNDIEVLKMKIENLREYRTRLQNLKLKADYQEIEKIDEAISALLNIRNLGMKPSVALEKWTNIALNIINDAILIKPNSPLGDDNEPIFTAPAGVPDIECFYDGFGAICKVTMLTSRDQWFNEGQPVMRHLREFEEEHSDVPNYCLFIAPSLHQDTLNTFWMAVKYEYQGKKQSIIPITINQLVEILKIIRDSKKNGHIISKNDMLRFYEACVSINEVSDSTLWNRYINKIISEWSGALSA